MALQDETVTARAAKGAARATTDGPLANAPCFIEQQFPVAKVSMESYKERKANYSQTLTGLGKWWGRKPLVLVRAAILGLLMPPSHDPVKDRDVFLKLLTMDEEGLWRRKNKSIPQKRLLEELRQMPPSIQGRFLDENAPPGRPCIRRLSKAERQDLQRLVFERMPYSEKLTFCCRPEHVNGPVEDAWGQINKHLGTAASNLHGLVEELGCQRFGHRPQIGDSFCGAGSVPFEAARIGCDVYGADLSPVAALLTWAAFNIVGGGDEVAEQVEQAQRKLFDAVDQKVTDWGIEHNEQGWRADAFLYCVEVRDPESGWLIPLAPSWVIGEKTNTVATLVPDEANKRFVIEIRSGASEEEMRHAKEAGTVANYRLVPPGGVPSTPIAALSRSLKKWKSSDIGTPPDDVFQERLYCVRWVETFYERVLDEDVIELDKDTAESLSDFADLVRSGHLKQKTRRHYRGVVDADLEREQRVCSLVSRHFAEWQAKGFLPSRAVQHGQDINRPTNARGWQYWHHFFNSRQLLINGLFGEMMAGASLNAAQRVVGLLGVARLADWNCRQCRWDSSAANEKGTQTFYKPSLATPVFNYCCRGLTALETAFFTNAPVYACHGRVTTDLRDARVNEAVADVWITDPPYADAVNYHELSEFFLAWYDKRLPGLFPDWHTDSKRALAIKADDPHVFRQSMVECYARLVEHMPDNGLQIVMFTHQEPSVWADLTLILWAAGLRVTAAWCIATETDSTLKQGNYVQGTVLLVCRKRKDAEPVFLDEINHRVEAEVRRQLDHMLALDDDSDPNFADADYQLAAYAAALRVLTERPIEEIDPSREIVRQRQADEVSPVETLIRGAVKIACDHLVPVGIDRETWKTLSAMERFYLKGLEVETHGEHRSGIFQELARGFGAGAYTELLASVRANRTRLKTASEFGRRMLSGEGFASSVVRQVLFSVHQVTRSEETTDGLNWLRTELPDYWNSRERIIEVLDSLARLDRVTGMDHWEKDSESARLLAGAVRNDHV